MDEKRGSLQGTKTIEMQVRVTSTIEHRAELLKEWYRVQLKDILPQLIEKWEIKIGAKCKSWGVKQMRTKWDTCIVASKEFG